MGRRSKSVDSSNISMANISSYFPNGVRIIVIDSDEASLHDVVAKLQCYKYYSVTPCTKASSALDILNHARGGFDLLLTEARIADMDGLALLRHVRMKFDVSIIIMSSERKLELALEYLNTGASLCLEKPVQYAALANIWQHVVSKRSASMPAGVREIEQVQRQPSSCSVTGDMIQKATAKMPVLEEQEGKEEEEKKEEEKEEENDEEKEDDDENEDVVDEDMGNDDDEEMEKEGSAGRRKKKKIRVVWTAQLHMNFVQAVNMLGVDNAVPRKILELMKVPGLTRAHVASHLQKYRLRLKRKAEEEEQATDSSMSSRFLMCKRKSVLDSVPDQSTLEHHRQVDVLPKGKSSPSMDQMGILTKGKSSSSIEQTGILPKGKSSCPMERSSVQRFRSPSQPKAYKGISLAPRQRERQKQQTLLPPSLVNTQLPDNHPRNNSFGIHYVRSSFPAEGAVPPFGKHNSLGFSTVPFAGNPGALNGPSFPWSCSLLTGEFPIAMSGMSEPPLATSYFNNYVGLQLQTATGHLEFAKDGCVIATEMLSADGGKVNADHESPDHLVLGNQMAAEEGNDIQIDFDRVSPGQIDSCITTSGNQTLTGLTTPARNVEEKNDLSVNDFVHIGFDSFPDTLEDLSFENFTSLLFDQEEAGHGEGNNHFTNS